MSLRTVFDRRDWIVVAGSTWTSWLLGGWWDGHPREWTLQLHAGPFSVHVTHFRRRKSTADLADGVYTATIRSLFECTRDDMSDEPTKFELVTDHTPEVQP